MVSVKPTTMTTSTLAMRLLVIEDESDLRKHLLRTLREEGYSADGAADGVDGLHKATEWDYDAILLDYQLPGMDGRELLRRLRKIKRTPVIMLTAHNAVDDRIAGLDLGADDYVAKPFEVNELLARASVPSSAVITAPRARSSSSGKSPSTPFPGA